MPSTDVAGPPAGQSLNVFKQPEESRKVSPPGKKSFLRRILASCGRPHLESHLW